MKCKRWMVLLLLCGVLLTACDRTEATQDTAGTTTVVPLTTNVTTAATTTVEEAVATTTATTTTTKPTVTPMENRTTVIASTAATTTTEVQTTTARPTPPTNLNVTDLRERQLDFYVNRETVRLTFSSESTLNGYAIYRYQGVSPAGISVECTLVPSENKIHEIVCSLPIDVGEKLTEEEVRDFIITEFKKEGSDLSDAKIDVFVMYNKGTGKIFASFNVFLESKNRINGTVIKNRGRLYFRNIGARTAFENPSTNYDDTKPFLAEYACSYLTPDWARE